MRLEDKSPYNFDRNPIRSALPKKEQRPQKKPQKFKQIKSNTYGFLLKKIINCLINATEHFLKSDNGRVGVPKKF